MDVQMPDGTIVTGVPDNITQSELLSRYQSYQPPEGGLASLQSTIAPTSNPLLGLVSRAGSLVGAGIEGIARLAEKAGDKLETAIPLSGLTTEQITKERQLEPLFQFAESTTNWAKGINYEPSTKLSDLGSNPLTVVPFIAERIISSSPDMLAAVVAMPAYVTARTNEILNDRLKNDEKTLDDATVKDVTMSLGGALLEATLERGATQALFKGAPISGASGKARIAKVMGYQSGTEAAEEGAAYLAGTVDTKKGVNTKELLENMAEGAIVGGGLGGSVQGTKEYLDYRNKKKEAAESIIKDEESGTPPAVPPVTPPVAPPVDPLSQEGAPSDIGVDRAAMEEEFLRSQGQLPLATPPVAQPAQIAQAGNVQVTPPGEPVSTPPADPAAQVAQIAPAGNVQPSAEDIVPLNDKGEPIETPKAPEVVDPNVEAQLAAEPFDPDSIILPPKEIAPPPPPPAAKKPKAPKVAQVYYGKDADGNTNVPVSEGGLPFATKAEAEKIKALQPELRVQKVKGGWLLGEKSEQYKAADKLRAQNLTKIDTPGLIGDILRMGGLDPAFKSALGFGEKENPSIGNRRLFAAPGKGVAPETVTEMYMEDRPDEAEFTGQDIDFEQSLPDRIKAELKRIQSGERIETPEQAYERRQEEDAIEYEAKQDELDKAAQIEAQDISAEVAAEQAVEAADLGNFRQQMLDAGYTEQDLNVIGFTKASPELQAEVAALEKQVSEAGLDPSGILESLGRTYGDRLITTQEYYKKAKDELAKAIREKAVQGGGRDVSQVDVQEGAEREEGLTSPSEQELKDKQEAADKAAADKAKADRDADAKAKTDAERKEIAARSEKAAGEFVLGKTAEEDLTGQKDAFSTSVQISPEQQKIDALNKFEAALSQAVPPFRAISSSRTVVLRPQPLNGKQIALIKDLASESIDLGMPASIFENVSAAGATRMGALAAISQDGGWLLLGGQWSAATRAEKLQALVHELGHSVDNKVAASSGKKVSEANLWQKAHDELKSWYDSAEIQITHPLHYPFANKFKGKLKPKSESFAQAFSFYFVSPVELQTNAPEAYSQIQSLIEGIQNGSQRASATSATKTGAAGVEVQPSRSTKGAEVQSDAGEVGSGVRQTERIEDRDNQDIDEIKKPSQPNLPGIAGKPKNQTQIPVAKPNATWTNLPDMTRKDNWILRIFDKNYNLKLVQKAIEEASRVLKDNLNVYRKETLSHGRIDDQVNRFLIDELSPVITEMQNTNTSDDALTEYLVMRHAEEANDLVAKRNPNNPAMQDNGIGVTYKERDDYFKELSLERKKVFESLAKKVDDILKKTLDILEDGKVISKEERKGWQDMFKYYIPARREESDFLMPSSSYRRVGDFAKSRVGSSRKVVDVLSNVAVNRQIAINRVEKERIYRAFYGLTLMHPNPEYFITVSPDAVKNRDALAAEIQSQFGMTDVEAREVVQYIMSEPNRKYFNKETGEVVSRTDTQAKYQDYVLPVKMDGKDRFIFFNPRNPRAMQMVQSLRGLDSQQLPRLLEIIAPVTRFFSAINTQYNLVFGVWNFGRDIQGAQINLSTTPIADRKKEVFNGTFKAMKDIFTALRERNAGKKYSDTSDGSYSDFVANGGKVGFQDQFQKVNDSSTIVERELAKLNRGNIKKATFATLNWISNVNDVLENAVRVSAYRAALNKFKKEAAEAKERQKTDPKVYVEPLDSMKARAADIAKNLTVNFNRKGTWGATAGSLFAFFNASAQGTARLYETLKGPTGKKIMAGGIALGMVQALALAMAGFDEDEPTEFIKQKNLIIPTGDGKYAMWPMPFGFNVFPNIGRILVEALSLTTQGKDASGKLYDTITMLGNAFNPLGGGGLLQMVSPTVLDPLVALTENRDSFGRPISRENRATAPKPGYTLSRDPSPSISQYLAEFINAVSFGNQDKRGWVSPTADQIDYLAAQVGGGVYREVSRAGKYAANLVEGKDTPESQVPLVGKIVGNINSPQAVSQRFYSNVKTMSEHEDAIKGRISRRESTSQYMRENPEASLWRRANSLENEISKLNTRRRDLIKQSAPFERIKNIDDQKTRMMKRFNDTVKQREAR
jgi:hypothetical protein